MILHRPQAVLISIQPAVGWGKYKTGFIPHEMHHDYGSGV